MNTEQVESNQTISVEQALVLAITRVKNAEVELEAAKSNLYNVSEQVTKQMVEAEYKDMKNKIEQLESAKSEKAKTK